MNTLALLEQCKLFLTDSTNSQSDKFMIEVKILTPKGVRESFKANLLEIKPVEGKPFADLIIDKHPFDELVMHAYTKNLTAGSVGTKFRVFCYVDGAPHKLGTAFVTQGVFTHDDC